MKKINDRESLLKEKVYNDLFPVLFNFPKIRNWYIQIFDPFDNEIVVLASEVLTSYNKDLVKNIRDK